MVILRLGVLRQVTWQGNVVCDAQSVRYAVFCVKRGGRGDCSAVGVRDHAQRGQ